MDIFRLHWLQAAFVAGNLTDSQKQELEQWSQESEANRILIEQWKDEEWLEAQRLYLKESDVGAALIKFYARVRLDDKN